MRTIMFGGYMPFREMEEEEKALFEKTKHPVGVKYTPLAVATQVVSGVNYRYLCTAAAIVPDAVPYNALVTIYSPLQGDAIITEIRKVVIE